MYEHLGAQVLLLSLVGVGGALVDGGVGSVFGSPVEGGVYLSFSIGFGFEAIQCPVVAHIPHVPVINLYFGSVQLEPCVLCEVFGGFERGLAGVAPLCQMRYQLNHLELRLVIIATPVAIELLRGSQGRIDCQNLL